MVLLGQNWWLDQALTARFSSSARTRAVLSPIHSHGPRERSVSVSADLAPESAATNQRRNRDARKRGRIALEKAPYVGESTDPEAEARLIGVYQD